MVEKSVSPTPSIENPGNSKIPRNLQNVQRLNIGAEEHQKK